MQQAAAFRRQSGMHRRGRSPEGDMTTVGESSDAHDQYPWSWYAIWTHSHCEQSVHEQLVERGFRSFLPVINTWSRRRGVKRLIPSPMFPGYLFLRHQMDKGGYIDVTRVKGVVRVLGERWDRLSPIPDDEIDSIEKAASGERRVLPFPYMAQGQRARITAGPLTGVEGI